MSTTRQEQPGTSVTEPSYQPAATPKVAAWRIGTLLNQLFFNMGRAWLASTQELLASVEAILSRLALTTRELGLDIQSEDGICDALETAKENWRSLISSEWRANAFNAAHARFVSEWQNSDTSEQESRKDICEEMLRGVEPVMTSVRQAVESKLNESLLRILRLSEFVDQAVRHRNMHYGLPGGPDHFPEVATSPGCTWNGVTIPAPVPLSTPSNSPITHSVFDAYWVQQLQQRWRQAMMPVDLADLDLSTLDDSKDMELIVQQINDKAEMALAANEPQGNDGLRLRVEVGQNDGMAYLDDTPIPVTRDCAVFLHELLRNPGHWVSGKEIQAEYPDFPSNHVARVKGNLPQQLRELLDPARGTGRGSRLLIERVRLS